MRTALAIVLTMLPMAAGAQTAPAAAPATATVVGVLSGDRVIAANGPAHFICKIADQGTDAYKLADCKPLDVALPMLDERAMFIQVFEQYGCRMTEEQAKVVLPTLGFDKDRTQALVEKLTAEGLMELSGDTAILKSENCK